MNIAKHIERGATLFPHKTALIFENRSYTYEQLNYVVNRLTNGLHKKGVSKGDRVALFLPNIPEFVISYLAILKLGAIAVSLNAMLKSSEVRYILNDCAAQVIITTETLSENVEVADLPYLEHMFFAEVKTSKGISLYHLIINAFPEAKAVKIEPKTPAAIIYTSGTTGFPKGATLSHGNIISNMYAQNRCCGMTADDRLLLYLPLFHCFGQNAILNSGFNVCATIVLQRRFNLEGVLEVISREKITMFFGVPTVYIKLLNDNLSASDWSSVRFCFSAASTMPVEIARRWEQQRGLRVYEGYGMTETAPCACYNHSLKYKFGSIGTPIENVEMKIVDDDGREVPTGELGEIAVRGPNVMLGYWNRPLDTDKAIRDGWFYTGDLGRRDEDGYFYIVDRLKDMINVSGFKVYPAEVENAIYQHPAVFEVAVYGVPNSVKGEIVKADIVLKPGYTTSAADIDAFCLEIIATYKRPQEIEFVDSLPKNGSGKILKRVLRQKQLSLSTF
ncbi:MAG: long-chain fatty acid--CoA ligase [Xenococcaceae cyanobacterium MO_188.B32]|nr:long-chain fatty acid--CoA ligase [Xenococcaceae cyanobacterium MO_188.B32]